MHILPNRRDEIQQLRQTVRDLHGCDSIHIGSEPVSAWLPGRPVWNGTVATFKLIDHPHAKLAYAWKHERDSAGRNCAAVLGIEPIRGPEDAVRSSVEADPSERVS
jgi:hypothetical protein